MNIESSNLILRFRKLDGMTWVVLTALAATLPKINMN